MIDEWLDEKIMVGHSSSRFSLNDSPNRSFSNHTISRFALYALESTQKCLPTSSSELTWCMQASEEELLKERACVSHLIPNAPPAACEITQDTMLPGEI